MKKRTFIIGFLLIGILSFLILQYFGVTSVGFSLNFETVGKGTYGRNKAGFHVIQSIEEWDEICKGCFPPDVNPPEIDFSTTTVIAVFMGQMPTAGYEIEVKEITDAFFKVVVKVAMKTPGAKPVLQVLTAPYHIVKTAKISKPIIFQKIWETTDC